MPYNKLNISGAKADILAWVNHDLSLDEQNMLRNVSRLPCLYKHVALMPDAHLGIGSMVGSVIAQKKRSFRQLSAWTSAVLRAIRSCRHLTENLIRFGNWRKMMKKLSFTPALKAEKSSRQKQRRRKLVSNAELVKVILDNGAEIRCTPDHKFMLRDGSFIEAENLKAGESLMPLYRETDKDGYVLVQQNYSGRMQKAHWIVGRSGLLGKVPTI